MILHSAKYHNFPYAGHVDNSSLYDVGSVGNYWSRTANSAGSAYYLDFDSSYIGSVDNNLRYRGFSIRCVATA